MSDGGATREGGDAADSLLSPRVPAVVLLSVLLGIVGSAIAFNSVGGSEVDDSALTGGEEFAVALPLLIALGGGACVAAAMDGRRIRSVFGVETLGLRGLIVGSGAGVALQFVAIGIDALIMTPVFGEAEDSGRDLVDAFDSAGEKVLLVLLIVVLAPVAEELFHRGVLVPLAAMRWRPTVAAILVGAFFALSHFDPRQLPALAVLGVSLGLLRIRFESVAPAVAGHLAFNAVGLAVIAMDLGW